MRSDTNLWVDEMVKRHGWYMHFNLMDDNYPYSVNIHTHGLSRFDHLDIQICYPLNREDAYIIMLYIVDSIKNGAKFTPGIKYSNILPDLDVEFAEAKEDGRIVLRIILPDKDGELRGDLKEQWKGCRIYFINN